MADGDKNAKQMTSDKLITFVELGEMGPLCQVALTRLDKNRVLQGKPKYETIDGMIDAYVEEADKAGLGWTRADAESEVCRYLRKQALADEGGIGGGGGDGQDSARRSRRRSLARRCDERGSASRSTAASPIQLGLLCSN